VGWDLFFCFFLEVEEFGGYGRGVGDGGFRVEIIRVGLKRRIEG